jgi:tRNA threonylcarbamoyladenosine biosynthesis protein TsaE
MKVKIDSLSDLENFARALQASLQGDEIIALIGDLGAGKTTFTKFFLKAAGIRTEVTSPTFVLMIPYITNTSPEQTFYHLDLYRIKNFAEAKGLGIEEFWGTPNNVFIIEWADKISRYLPKKTIRIRFELTKKGRELTIENAPKNLAKMLK